MNTPFRDSNHGRIGPSSSGFSLLEVLIGICIGVGTILTIYQVVRSSNQTMTLSSQHFIALHLSSKLMADIFEESRLNGTLIENFDEFPDMSTRDQVVDAQSAFFHHIRDSKAPWGVMEPGADYGISSDMGEAYAIHKPFFVKASVSRWGAPTSPGPEKHIAVSTIKVDWGEAAGRSRSYSLEFHCPSTSGALPEEKYQCDDETLKTRILEEFFPGSTGMSFDQVVSANGCDREMLIKSGKIGVLMSDLTASLASLSNEIRILETARVPLLKTPGPALIQTQILIARKIESGASLLFNVLLEGAREAGDIRDRGTSGSLAHIPYAPFEKGLRTLHTLSGEIMQWVEKSGDAFAFVLNDAFAGIISPKQREFAMLKTLEALRLRVALGSASSASFRSFLEKESARVRGKNHFLERLFLREDMALKSLKIQGEAFPNLVAIVDKYRNVLLKTASAVSQTIALHPLHGGTGK